MGIKMVENKELRNFTNMEDFQRRKETSLFITGLAIIVIERSIPLMKRHL